MNDNTLLRLKVDQAWERAWTHFFRPETNLFYDTLTSDNPEQELALLPTPEEVRKQFPNPCGWRTGMEDSMISGGTVLSMLCDQYTVTRESWLIEIAEKILQGMCSCLEIHGVPGFLARSICLADRKSVYINSSRDQYTHFVHGLWRFYHSDFISTKQQEHIRQCLVNVAQYMDHCITPENNWSILRLDGSKEPISVCKMVGVRPHEAARLAMFYIAAWDVSHDSHWMEQYLKYIPEAAQCSARPEKPNARPYELMQKVCSLEVILSLDHAHPEITSLLHKAMENAFAVAEAQAPSAGELYRESDPCRIMKDWRPLTCRDWDSYQVPVPSPEDSAAFEGLRGVGELALTSLIASHTLLDNCRKELKEALMNTDFSKVCTRSIHYVQAAYWRALRYGISL